MNTDKVKHTRKIRVLHIITNLPIGGAQDNTLITVERLNRSRYDVSLIAANDGEWVTRAKQIKNLQLIFVDALTRPIHIFNDMIAFYKIYQIIKKNKYDIVHTHSSKPGFLGRIAAVLAGVPIIIHTIHGFPFNDFMHPVVRWFFIFIERFLSYLSDKLITVSRLNLQHALKLKLATSQKLINIYSGIDFSKFNKKIDVTKKRHDLNIPNNTKVVGLIGRLSYQKGPEYFIQAAQLILQKEDNVLFLLIGDGKLREKCVKLAARLGISSQIKILGFRDDIPELLQVLDIYVLSSRWEGLGRSLTEALYLAKPTVATSVDGVPELVQNKKTGILVPPANPQALAEGVLYLLNDLDKGKKMAHNAKKLVEENFSADKMVSEIDELYQTLISDKHAQSH